MSFTAGGRTPNNNVKTTWGTRQRIAAVLGSLDDSDYDEVIDRATKIGGAPRFITRWYPTPSWLWCQWNGMASVGVLEAH
eukprot:5868986-Pleurochrysis_carterae.AAC.1